MLSGTYEWAQARHATGAWVTCGKGTRSPLHTWNELLDIQGERESAEWREVRCPYGSPDNDPEYTQWSAHMVDYAREFSGLDDAQVSERLPKLKTGAYRLKVIENKRIESEENGVTFVTEVEVLYSTNPEVPVGDKRAITINGYTENNSKGKTKRGNLKAQIAASIGVPHTTPQNYGGIAAFAITHGVLEGCVFQAAVQEAETKPKKAGDPVYEYLQITYRPDDANPRPISVIADDLKSGRLQAKATAA